MNYFLISYEVDFGMDIAVQRDVLVKTELHEAEVYFEKLKKVFEEESEGENMTLLGCKFLLPDTFRALKDTKMMVFDDETIEEEDDWLTRDHMMNYSRSGNDFGIKDILHEDVKRELTVGELGIDEKDFEIINVTLGDYVILFKLNAPEQVHRKIETAYRFDGNWNH